MLTLEDLSLSEELGVYAGSLLRVCKRLPQENGIAKPSTTSGSPCGRIAGLYTSRSPELVLNGFGTGHVELT